MAESELDPALAAWIEKTLRGRITRSERQGRWRPQWFVDVSVDGNQVPILVRQQRAGGPRRFLEQFSIGHEADVLQALQETDVRVAKFYGFHEPTQSILCERLTGESDLGLVEDHERRSGLYRQYVDNLVRLHCLDPSSLRLDLKSPRSAYEVAFAKLRPFMLDYADVRPRIRPEPLLNFGLWWLENNVPQHFSRLSVLQGDSGPGQFMFDGDRVTGLIDWEMTHIGDPMSDLAVMRLRNAEYPIGGPINDFIKYYKEVSDVPFDRDRLIFHTVIVSIMSSLGLAEMMQRPSASVDLTLPGFGLDIIHRRFTCASIAEAVGVTLEVPEIPPAKRSVRGPLHDFLVDHLESVCLKTAQSEIARFQLRGAVGVAKALRLSDELGPYCEEQDIDDIGALVGKRPDDYEDALHRLQAIVQDAPGANLEVLLKVFYRIEIRRETLLRPILFAQHSDAYEPLDV